MNFEYNDLVIIRTSLEERAEKILNNIKQWNDLEWNNIGSMQNMYASEQAFNDQKKSMLEIWNEEYDKIDKMLERIYEEI